MTSRSLVSAAAMAAALLALAACNKSGGSAPPAADQTNNATASSSPAVAGAEDATSAAVGGLSAATTMTAGGFVTAAATSDMYEIQAAKMAEHKSTNPAVKKFAARMIHDHTASSAKLKTLVDGGGVTATLPTALDERRKGLLNNLSSASAADFDSTYVDQQVAAHQEAATLLKGYADHGDNDALKGFATSILPTVQEHLSMAKDMQAAMKK